MIKGMVKDKKTRMKLVDVCRRALGNFRKYWKEGIGVKSWEGRIYIVSISKEQVYCGGAVVYYDFIVFNKDTKETFLVRQLKRRWNIYEVDVKTEDDDYDDVCEE